MAAGFVCGRSFVCWGETKEVTKKNMLMVRKKMGDKRNGRELARKEQKEREREGRR